MSNFSQLRNKAHIIRDATIIGENTALRIGNLFDELISSVQDVASTIPTEAPLNVASKLIDEDGHPLSYSPLRNLMCFTDGVPASSNLFEPTFVFTHGADSTGKITVPLNAPATFAFATAPAVSLVIAATSGDCPAPRTMTLAIGNKAPSSISLILPANSPVTQYLYGANGDSVSSIAIAKDAIAVFRIFHFGSAVHIIRLN